MRDIYYEIAEETTPKIPTLLRFVDAYEYQIKKWSFILQVLYVIGPKLDSATFYFIQVPTLLRHLDMRE